MQSTLETETPDTLRDMIAALVRYAHPETFDAIADRIDLIGAALCRRTASGTDSDID